MGLLRALNPLCTNVTAPRHRQARALEVLAGAERDRQRAELAAQRADLQRRAAALAGVAPASRPPVKMATLAEQVAREAAAIAALQAAGVEVPAQDLAVLARRQAQVAG